MQVAAGGALFNLVMDTDDQASDLLRLLKKECRGGRITCLPLNKLRAESVTYPQQFGSDAVPLTKYLQYDRKHEIAIKHVRLFASRMGRAFLVAELSFQKGPADCVFKGAVREHELIVATAATIFRSW